MLLRPIFLDYCGTESEHRAFTANLRTGRPASISEGSTGIELLRSEPYLYAPPQRCEAGVRQIVYYPELFDVECKAQKDDIWLCVMPPASLLNTLTVAEIGSCRAALRLTNEAIAAERARIEEENASVEYWRKRSLPPDLTMDTDAILYWALVGNCVSAWMRAPDIRSHMHLNFALSWCNISSHRAIASARRTTPCARSPAHTIHIKCPCEWTHPARRGVAAMIVDICLRWRYPSRKTN